jgi:hypothetical protein
MKLDSPVFLNLDPNSRELYEPAQRGEQTELAPPQERKGGPITPAPEGESSNPGSTGVRR